MEGIRQGLEWIAENPAITTVAGMGVALGLGYLTLRKKLKPKHTAHGVARQIIDNTENESEREKQEVLDLCVQRMGGFGGYAGIAMMVKYDQAREAGEEWTQQYRNSADFVKDLINKADESKRKVDESERKYPGYERILLGKGPQGAD